jgi:ribosomal-protein-serine acetyltransferase
MDKMLLELPTSLETERLTLRCYQNGDGPAFLTMIRENKEHFADALNEKELGLSTEEEAEIFVRELAVGWVARKKFLFGVCEKSTGELVAQVEIWPVDWKTPDFEIGYFIVKKREGQGIVSEAVKALLGFGFVHLGAHRMTIRCDDINTRSANVAKRCGFVQEGHIREKKRGKDDGYVGLLQYGLLRSEYEKISGDKMQSILNPKSHE